ncbi:MAG: hypothetical protein OXT08_04840, partial [Candidatus Marinimicrobia bacterium]|nr:hypothetical protein [Candidatus Neomarinimicrobiota bacterium]
DFDDGCYAPASYDYVTMHYMQKVFDYRGGGDAMLKYIITNNGEVYEKIRTFKSSIDRLDYQYGVVYFLIKKTVQQLLSGDQREEHRSRVLRDLKTTIDIVVS